MNDVVVTDLMIDELKPLNEPKSPVWKTDVIKDVEVDIDIRLGGASVTINELFSWKKGSVVTLDNQLNQPVDVLLNQKVVGKGMLVACGDYYGVEITDVIE